MFIETSELYLFIYLFIFCPSFRSFSQKSFSRELLQEIEKNIYLKPVTVFHRLRIIPSTFWRLQVHVLELNRERSGIETFI